MKLLPGFRDFYPDDCAQRNYVISTWRKVAARYGFVEVDGPVLEPVELFQKKSGGELVGQLFDFTDKGGRHVALRPEMTPTLARMVAARERDYRKPMKWFSVAQFFRYEKQQRGRLREFLQLNCDLIGDDSAGADAEVLALLLDLLREFGFTSADFVLRLSDRQAWVDFLVQKGRDASEATAFLSIIDKWERDPPDILATKLQAFDCTVDEVKNFLSDPTSHSPRLQALAENLRQRGFQDYFEIDLTIVRGLAYYNGLVFEVFDRARKLRALAGGGRYDNLISLMSDGATDLAAIGFGMGDVVLGELIGMIPNAKNIAANSCAKTRALDLYVVIADEAHRKDALTIVQELRDAGFSTDYPLSTVKVGKQFQLAEQSGASRAVVVGSEFPTVKIKDLALRIELETTKTDILKSIKENIPA